MAASAQTKCHTVMLFSSGGFLSIAIGGCERGGIKNQK